MYNLGRQLRERYNDLLGPYYSPQWLYVRTTDKDRTHMSAQTFLAGLYPPIGSKLWSSIVNNWQPIPIHSFPLENDPVIY